jgi:hypothetical protein
MRHGGGFFSEHLCRDMNAVPRVFLPGILIESFQPFPFVPTADSVNLLFQSERFTSQCDLYVFRQQKARILISSPSFDTLLFER